MIHTVLKNANQFWCALYYDHVVITNQVQISVLKNADRPFYNAGHALNSLDHWDWLEATFAQQGLTPAFYQDPQSPPGFAEHLNAHGYEEYPSEQEHWYYSPDPGHEPVLPAGCFIKTDALEDFLTVNAIGNALTPEMTERLRQRIPKCPEFHYYVLYEGQTPVAVAAYGVVDDMAFGAESATLPSYQQRGYNTYLMRKRRYDAGARDFWVVCEHNAYSNNTCLRIGMQHAFDRHFFRKIS